MTYGTTTDTGPGLARYSASDAQYHPETLSDLNKVAKEARDKVIWLPKVIDVPEVADPTHRMILPYAFDEGVVLASDGTGGLNVTGRVKGAFGTGIRFKSHTKLSGVKIEGPTNLGTPGSVGGCYTMFALKLSGVIDVQIEDCDLFNFPQGIICMDNVLASGPEDLKWDSPNRVRILRTNIHGAQAHGWGYGVLQSNSNGKALAAYLRQCRFWDCRHHLACDHGAPFNFEFDGCDFDDAWYWSANIVGGTKYYACQIDAHGSGHSTGGHAGRHYEGHDSTFSQNGNKANIGIRGIPDDECRFYRCWTRKSHHEGRYPAEGYEHKFTGGGFVDLEAGEGGAWSKTPCSLCDSGTYNHLDEHRVYVWNNWYGAGEPPEGPPETPDEPPVEVNTPDIQVASLDAPQVEVGQTYTITATVENKGDGPGSADIEIGYIIGGTKRPLLTQTVELEAGQSATVVRTAKATSVGQWTFYCGNLTTILTVTEPSLKVTTEVIKYGGGA